MVTVDQASPFDPCNSFSFSRSFRFLRDARPVLRVCRSICKRNSRSQIGPYSGLQTMRTKMRERAGQMDEEEEENRRWIELGGRKTCWKEELLTHL
jgi:hypothetical protein